MELQDFPLLRDCLQNVDPDVGFDIEIKYPLDLKVSLPIKFNLPSAKPICSLFSFLCLVSTWVAVEKYLWLWEYRHIFNHLKFPYSLWGNYFGNLSDANFTFYLIRPLKLEVHLNRWVEVKWTIFLNVISTWIPSFVKSLNTLEIDAFSSPASTQILVLCTLFVTFFLSFWIFELSELSKLLPNCFFAWNKPSLTVLYRLLSLQ